MPYIRAEVGEEPAGSDKSMRIYYDEYGNKMIRVEGSRSWRNNNPGNLKYYPFTKENGAIGTDGTFLQPTDWIEQQGYRITTPIRTLFDLAQTRQISDELIEQAVLEGRKRGILIKQQIDALPSSEAGCLLKRFYGQKYI